MLSKILTQISLTNSLILILLFQGHSYSQGTGIYIINYAWHTGIILPVDSLSKKYIPALNHFSSCGYADIGWGDEDFYQEEDLNLFLGAKALLIPTTSAIRIEGYKMDVKKALSYFEKCVLIKADSVAYTNLLRFIQGSFNTGRGGTLKILSSKEKGRIVYNKARGSYYLYNTCNTWIARALKAAGYEIDYEGIVTADDVFSAVKKFSINLK